MELSLLSCFFSSPPHSCFSVIGIALGARAVMLLIKLRSEVLKMQNSQEAAWRLGLAKDAANFQSPGCVAAHQLLHSAGAAARTATGDPFEVQEMHVQFD